MYMYIFVIYVVCATYQRMNKVLKILVCSSHWTALPIVDSSRTNFGSSRNWMKPFETKFWKYIYEIRKWSAEVYDLSLNISHHKTWYLALCFDNTHCLKRYSGHKISQAEKSWNFHLLWNWQNLFPLICQSVRRKGHAGSLLFIDLKCRKVAQIWHL